MTRPADVDASDWMLPTQNVDERAETQPYLRPVFFGEECSLPPHPADLPLPKPPKLLEPATTISARTRRRTG